MSSHKKNASIALGIAVGGALFYFAFRDVSFTQFARLAANGSPGWLAILLLIPAIDLGIRAVRWRLLLKPLAPTRTSTTYQFEAVGMALNNIMFLRLGEVVRGVLLARELKISALSVFATILIERLCDLAALLALYALGATLLPGVMDPQIRLWAGIGSLGIVAVLAVMTTAGDRILASPAGGWLARFPRILGLARDLVAGAKCLRSWDVAVPVAVTSLALWFLDAYLFLAAAQTLRLDPRLSFPQALMVLSSAAAGTALPAMPGAFGNFEAAVKLMLVQFGYSKTTALSLATCAHLSSYIVMTAIGLICFFRLGHSLSSLKQLLERHK